jgi:NADH-quinone oxidoreductase subunit G
MPSFKMDDREIPFEKGETIIKAAQRAGIDVPHYCWHPGLSVAANCRMCLVEVLPPPGRPALQLSVLNYDEKSGQYMPQTKPKLQPACQLAAAEGMEVKSESSQHVKRARSAVQELLLLNHPVDCPICDQAGECRLQDYWLEHQHESKKMHDEPVHKPKGVVFGPTIVYDAERCIVCTRCVRFCEEVAKDKVLDVRERGNLNEIVLAPGRKLDHAYTLMTEHVCPVGALTAVDFRFKARVWFLRSARTICQGCATGCNAYLDYDPRNNRVHRHRPRENMSVNSYWMCDEGMLDYQRVHEGRVLYAGIAGEAVRLAAALDKAADVLKSAAPEKLAVVLSAQHSHEDNFALLQLAREHVKTSQLFWSGKPQGTGDDVLRHADKNPNSAGVRKIAPAARPIAELKALIDSGAITHALVLGADVPTAEAAQALARLRGSVVLAVNQGIAVGAASVVLPASSWAETGGTFINAKGMTQQSDAAIEPQGDSRPAWKLVAALAVRMGFPVAWRKLEQLEQAMLAGGVGRTERASLFPGAGVPGAGAAE